MKKKHILLFCGGQSQEHEISLRSASHILKSLNPEKFDVSIIGIDQGGNWHKLSANVLLEHNDMSTVESKPLEIAELAIKMGDQKNLLQTKQHSLILREVDLAFPILHGPNGEDGTIQGLLRLANIPYVGSNILSSAICMDKDITKRLLRDAQLPIGDFLTFRRQQTIDYDAVVAKLGLPFFVKPCNLGSSVGISKVKTAEEFSPAITEAFSYDQKIIIEAFIPGREIECAVLGNNPPIASLPGEIIPHDEFYSYAAKYLNSNGATTVTQAILNPEIIKKIQHYAVEAFQVLGCSDLARVDFFLTNDDQIIINEINTMPGFTSISMYPKMWQNMGLGDEALVEQLIELALTRYLNHSLEN